MSKKKKKRGLFAIDLSARKRAIIIAAIVAVVLLAVAAVALAILVNRSKQSNDSNDTPLTAEQRHEMEMQEASNLLSIVTDAQSAMERGDSDRVHAIYESEVRNTKDATKKIKLLIDESRVYVYGEKYDKAIAAAKEAEPLSKDKFLVAEQLAYVYWQDKQYAEAAKYYELAGKWVSSPNNTGGFKKDYYAKKATDMRSLAEGKR